MQHKTPHTPANTPAHTIQAAEQALEAPGPIHTPPKSENIKGKERVPPERQAVAAPVAHADAEEQTRTAAAAAESVVRLHLTLDTRAQEEIVAPDGLRLEHPTYTPTISQRNTSAATNYESTNSWFAH
jgi:hypothetical protein